MIINNFPKKIAIFPLSAAIFFPQTVLPLHIFEKKYIQMIDDCMKNDRLFGMVQPKIRSISKPEVYKVGCLGKIVSFNETDDRRFIINLSGIIRFRIKDELETKKLYREFNVDYSDFMDDLSIKETDKEKLESKDLIKKIKFFFKRKNYFIKFDELEKLNFNQFINTICMIAPFSAEEKQKLIETSGTKEKIKILNEIINLNLADNFENKTIQ